jgi:hypothetical protein
MMNATMESPEIVLDLLREQDHLYGQLEAIAVRQRTIVTNESTAPLFTLLADRQRLSMTLHDVAKRLQPIRTRWQEFRRECSDSQRSEVDTLVRRCSERLQRVIAGDEADARLLAVRKQTVSRQLKELDHVSQGINAYRGATVRSRIDCMNEVQG